MDVKSTFLNGFIEQEVYVKQPLDSQDTSNTNHSFKLKKALCGLKQALRAWYDKLSSFPLECGFERGKVDNTLFKKECKKDFLILQVYVDNIILGFTNESLCKDFS